MLVPLLLLMLMFIALLCLLIFFGGRWLVQKPKPDPAATPADYGLAYEGVEFPSHYKALIRGWWLPAESPLGTLILCHGQSGSMEGDLAMAAALRGAGYNLLMFNFRAHGTSEGGQVTFGVFEKEDLLGALDFLASEKNIQQVGVVGLSMGAGVALITAALTDKIRVLVLDGLYLRFLTLVQRAAKERLPGLLAPIAGQLMVLGANIVTNTRMYQVSPVLWVKHLSPEIPVLFIHGERDQYTSLAEIESLAADLAGPHQIWVAPACQHREAFRKYPQEYLDQVVAHLERAPWD